MPLLATGRVACPMPHGAPSSVMLIPPSLFRLPGHLPNVPCYRGLFVSVGKVEPAANIRHPRWPSQLHASQCCAEQSNEIMYSDILMNRSLPSWGCETVKRLLRKALRFRMESTIRCGGRLVCSALPGTTGMSSRFRDRSARVVLTASGGIARKQEG